MITEIIRWVIAGMAGCLFVFLAGFSFWCWFVQTRKTDEPHVSSVPILGGLFGFASVLVAPVGAIMRRLCFAWIPLLLDVGCVWYAIGATLSYMASKKARP